LEAIRNPDIIPPDVAQQALKTIGKTLQNSGRHFLHARLKQVLVDEYGCFWG
jgi:hypothetical protein